MKKQQNTMDEKKFINQLDLEPSLISKIYGLEDLSQIKSLSELFFYTGKGPSNDIMHIGHYLIFNRFAKLSEKAPVIIQISADEKRNVKPQYVSYEKAKTYSENFLTVLKNYFDWNEKNTYVVDNLQPKTSLLLHNCANYISKYVRLKTVLGAFGNINVYSSYYLALQLAPILLFQKIQKNKRCVIITAEDQKPYFLIMRDIASKLKLKKPIMVVLNGLKDIKLKDKMSASACKYAITVHPSLNEKNLLKSISAPFKEKKPDSQNDYIAYFMRTLISNNFCAEELKQIYAEYKENSTFEIKTKVNTVLKHYFDKKIVKKVVDFKTLVPENITLDHIPVLLTDFERFYVSQS